MLPLLSELMGSSGKMCSPGSPTPPAPQPAMLLCPIWSVPKSLAVVTTTSSASTHLPFPGGETSVPAGGAPSPSFIFHSFPYFPGWSPPSPWPLALQPFLVFCHLPVVFCSGGLHCLCSWPPCGSEDRIHRMIPVSPQPSCRMSTPTHPQPWLPLVLPDLPLPVPSRLPLFFFLNF